MQFTVLCYNKLGDSTHPHCGFVNHFHALKYILSGTGTLLCLIYWTGAPASSQNICSLENYFKKIVAAKSISFNHNKCRNKQSKQLCLFCKTKTVCYKSKKTKSLSLSNIDYRSSCWKMSQLSFSWIVPASFSPARLYPNFDRRKRCRV